MTRPSHSGAIFGAPDRNIKAFGLRGLLAQVTLLATFLATTIAWATTTVDSYHVFKWLRTYLFLPTATGAMVLSLGSQLGRVTLKAALVWFLVFVYGLALMLMHVHHWSQGPQALVNFFLMNLVFLFVFTTAPADPFDTRFLRWLYLFFVATFIFTWTTSGFELFYPPRFFFEAQALRLDADPNYSQGASKFYGLATLVAALLTASAKQRWKKAALLLSALIFLLLSFIGAGRGEAIATMAVVIMVFRKKGLFLVTSLLAGVVWLMPESLMERLFADYSIIARFFSSNDLLGMRGILAGQSVELLADNPGCLLFGCGYGFFQSWFDYEPGMYPHNLFLELVIVYGLPLTAVLLISSGAAAWRSLRWAARVSPFWYFLLYFVLISIKSGSLISSWFVTAALLFLAL